MRGKLLALFMITSLFTTVVTLRVPLQAASAKPAPLSFRMGGEVNKRGTWTVARVEKDLKDKVQEVSYVYKGVSYVSRCISLLDFVKSAEPKTRKGVGNPLLGMVAVVRAGNGYTASFGLGEIMPEYGGKEVWIVLDREGKPLPVDEGPIRLLIPSEPDRRERWVYGISFITLIDGAKVAKK